MAHPYDPSSIEPKWQKIWEDTQPNRASDDPTKKKFYSLIEFPFPSSGGLHVGHIRSNAAMDIISRKRRREGYNVLYPIGWDAFGLPTENYAIKTGLPPAQVTKTNTDNFRKQLKSLGFSFDWSREVNTSDPAYYRWTQWIFLQFFKKGLAYKKKMTVNWCPKDLIVLANEEVIDGNCERCGTAVEKREKEQWMLAITKYADRLDADLDTVDYLPKIKTQQRNWIGKSEGAEIDFALTGGKTVKVFTTRPDTLFGVTYIVLAPEHALVKEFLATVSNADEVNKYIAAAKVKEEAVRTDATAAKTGVELKGITAINPVNKESVPVWIADYVLADYGTGAVMAVPAHDERDYEFAQTYKLSIKEVVIPHVIDARNPPVAGKKSVVRKNVQAIIRDPKTGKIMCLAWKKFAWTTFPMGGIDEGEDPITAAKREVLEETGYKNLTNAKLLGGEVCAEYFAAHKDENRISYTSLVTFDLADDERDTIAADETAKFDVIWKDMKDITVTSMTHAEMPIWLERLAQKSSAFTDDGIVVNSGKFDGKNSATIKKEITESVVGTWVTKYKLRDWIFSRQRYWGEPIPVVHCVKCGYVAVPEDQLPVTLPEVGKYIPTETGESPLAAVTEWVNTNCPTCGGPAQRETDTMPNWAGSSWYYLRYADAHNTTAFAAADKLKYWTPVDWYNGGMEHTTLHLLYSRFWHKFLFDLGLVPTSEPYQKRTSHGLILAEGGAKMSKSVGNVVNPDELVKIYGADAVRLYEMFMGPFDQAVSWDSDAIVGPRRFIERVWKLADKIAGGTVTTGNDSESAKVAMNKAIKKVSEDIEEMHFNTAISSLMILVNVLEKETSVSREAYEVVLKLLAPFAPHVTEELWSMVGNTTSVHIAEWPVADPKYLVESSVTVVVQVQGKVRGSFAAAQGTSNASLQATALALPEVAKWLEGKTPKKVIVIQGKLVSIVL